LVEEEVGFAIFLAISKRDKFTFPWDDQGMSIKLSGDTVDTNCSKIHCSTENMATVFYFTEI